VPIQDWGRSLRKVLASGLSREQFAYGERRETQLNIPSKELLALPFYNLLPTDHVELVAFRVYVRKRCLSDLEFRADILEMCRQDICFFANVFCFVFEPRPPRGIPVKLWTDQANCLVWAWECFGRRDMGVEKTRGIGFSCLMAILYYWAARFHPQSKLGLTTKDETTLDGPDANSILGKIVYTHENMPAWFRLGRNGRDILKRNTTEHLLWFTDNNSTVQGFVPMNQKIRGLRFTSFFYDEFAFFPRDVQASLNSSVHTAPNRYFISTWSGADSVFHKIMRVERNTMLRVLTYWWNNEERWKGCYCVTKAGVVEIIDKNYAFPPDYQFCHDTPGLLRSPWVDFELSRPGATSDMQAALEELYGLQAEFGRKLFRPAAIEIAAVTVRPPTVEGNLENVGGEWKFVVERGGPIRLWGSIAALVLTGERKGGPYSAGCDLSEGLGATYSTLEVVDLKGGEQVLELAVDDKDPRDFAPYVVNILRWFCGRDGDEFCYLTFENNGRQGTVFGDELTELGYGNVMRTAYAGKVKRSDEPGSTYLGMRNGDGGLLILTELGKATLGGGCIVRSDDVRHEMSMFDKGEDEKPNYPRSEKSHGDRTHGLALAWWQGRKRMEPVAAEQRTEMRREIEHYRPQKRTWSSSWTLTKR
jgi:hypothetical protein